MSDKEFAIGAAIKSIEIHRKDLEEYSKKNPEFISTLKPFSVRKGPMIARLMAEASEKVDVGPMAAVAGVLADLAAKAMVEAGSKVAVVENGGEISAFSDEQIDVALLAGDAPLSKKIGFRLTHFPIGLATSSGLYSHAFSFGKAEAVTVFCRNAGLADAVATAAANLVKGDNYLEAIQIGLEKALSIQGVEGALVLYKGHIGTGGKIPQIIKII